MLSDVSVTNTDLDTAMLVIAPTTGLTTDEEGAVASIAVSLSSQPDSEVSVTFASLNTEQGLVDTDDVTAGSQSTVVFTPKTWSTARTVRFIGQDADGVNNAVTGVAYQIQVQPLVSDDAHFSGVTTTALDVVNLPANAVPVLSPIADVSALENVASLASIVTGIDSGQSLEVQTITMTAVSSNTSLIADPIPLLTPRTIDGSSTILDLTPVQGQSGSTTITVSVADDDSIDGNTKATVRTFLVTISAVNDAPVIAAVMPVTFLEDSDGATVSLTGISSGSPLENQSLIVTAVSGNTALIQTPLITYVSPSSTGSIQIVPVANTSGNTTVTVTVRDDGDTVNGGVNQATLVIQIQVLPVNDPPTINALISRSISEDRPEQIIALSGITSGAADESETLTVTCSSSNTALIPTPTITYTSPDLTGALRFTPASGQAGIATITVSVRDGDPLLGGLSVTRSFVVTVEPINDPPVAMMTDPLTRQISIGSTYVILSSDLVASDQDAVVVNPNLVFTLLLVPGSGILKKNGKAMQINEQFTQVDLFAGDIAYHHLGGSGTSDGFAFVVTDLGIPANSISVTPPLPVAHLNPATSAPQVFSIVINRQKPSIVLNGTPPIFIENQANGVLVAELATVEDGDSPTFADGEIRVSMPTATPADRSAMTLAIRDQGSNIGEVSVVGASIRIKNPSNVIEDVGTITGGQAGSDLVIACSVFMTPAIAQRVLRNLIFMTSSDDPPSSVDVSAIIRDAAIGDTSSVALQTVAITPVNDVPTCTAALVTTVANQPVSGRIVVSDPDNIQFTFTVTQTPVKGVLSAIAANGTFTYTPAMDLSGNDQFTVIVSDGIDASVAQVVFIRISGTGSSGRPWIISDPPVEVHDGDLLRSTVLVSTLDLPRNFDLVFSLIDAPAGMTIVESATDTAVLTWTAVRTSGDHLSFRIRATETVSGVTVDQPVLLFIHPGTRGTN